ncbi:transposable element Tcb2 transposase [Trichonephila clavipes]|nr:transposable element Tcb2 transposase [Trichonephila clavipes]
MDDNARPHRTLAVEELLESEDITRMDWTAYSPDLNPIEHVYDALGIRIAARLHHPENTQQFKQMLIEEWVLLPQEMLHQLVLSMRRRLGQRKQVCLQWIPSPVGVPGNEFADELAGKGCDLPNPSSTVLPIRKFIPSKEIK